jgi:hypothetical protein
MGIENDDVLLSLNGLEKCIPPGLTGWLAAPVIGVALRAALGWSASDLVAPLDVTFFSDVVLRTLLDLPASDLFAALRGAFFFAVAMIVPLCICTQPLLSN